MVNMDQYHHERPPTTAVEPKAPFKTSGDPQREIRMLREQVDQQAIQIRDLLQEIRRLKSKLDDHAAAINNMRGRGG